MDMFDVMLAKKLAGGGGGGGKINYSETEHEVGTWVDGSTLYEKTIHYDSAISSSATIDDSLTNSNTEYFVCTELSYIVNDTYRGCGLQIEVYIDSNGVNVDRNNAPSLTLSDLYATIRYTKASA